LGLRAKPALVPWASISVMKNKKIRSRSESVGVAGKARFSALGFDFCHEKQESHVAFFMRFSDDSSYWV
jgi:hypothetical protein